MIKVVTAIALLYAWLAALATAAEVIPGEKRPLIDLLTGRATASA